MFHSQSAHTSSSAVFTAIKHAKQTAAIFVISLFAKKLVKTALSEIRSACLFKGPIINYGGGGVESEVSSPRNFLPDVKVAL